MESIEDLAVLVSDIKNGKQTAKQTGIDEQSLKASTGGTKAPAAGEEEDRDPHTQEYVVLSCSCQCRQLTCADQ